MYSKRIYSVFVVILFFIISIAPLALPTGTKMENWGEDTRLTFNDFLSLSPAIGVEGENVHVVYADNEGGGIYDMYLWYINSSDNGNTWSSPICLVNGLLTKILFPKIAIYKENVHVIWLDYYDKKIHYIRSNNNGKNWTSEIVISSIAYHNSDNWDMGIYENNLHVVYINQNYKLSYIQSTNNGRNWSSPRVVIPLSSKVIETAIAVNGNNIHIAFRDTRDRYGNVISDVFYIKSIDGGVNWDNDVDVSSISGIDTLCDYPDIAVNGSDVFVVYRDYGPGRRQIYLSYSHDNGVTWDKGMRFSDSPSSIVVPAIAVESENVGVVWEDNRNASEGSWELYFKNSYNGGNNWGVDVRLTTAPESSDSPDIVINDNTVHIVWSDVRDGNREVYYKQMSIRPPLISAVVDVKPDTLNIKSKGNWITCYIELQEGYDLNDIDVSTIKISNINGNPICISAEIHPVEINDYDHDGIPDIMVKFDRSEVEDDIGPGDAIITIAGKYGDDTVFEGNDTVRIILPP